MSKTTNVNFTTVDSEEEAMVLAPLLFAVVGDTFVHHALEGDRGCRWLEPDTFEYLGRADGSTKTPLGWFQFRLVSEYSRGICQEGSNTYAGCNGGMLDAVGAWPLSKYRNYKHDNTYNDEELALPISMCCGFRKPDEHEEDDEEEALVREAGAAVYGI